MTEGKNRTAMITEISLISATIFWGLNFVVATLRN
jgi:hypothetical protein